MCCEGVAHGFSRATLRVSLHLCEQPLQGHTSRRGVLAAALDLGQCSGSEVATLRVSALALSQTGLLSSACLGKRTLP